MNENFRVLYGHRGETLAEHVVYVSNAYPLDRSPRSLDLPMDY